VSDHVISAVVALLAVFIGQGLLPYFRDHGLLDHKQVQAHTDGLVSLTKEIAAMSREVGILATEVHGFQGHNGLKGEIRELRAAVARFEERINFCQMGSCGK